MQCQGCQCAECKGKDELAATTMAKQMRRIAELEAELLAYKGGRVLLKQEIRDLRHLDPAE